MPLSDEDLAKELAKIKKREEELRIDKGQVNTNVDPEQILNNIVVPETVVPETEDTNQKKVDKVVKTTEAKSEQIDPQLKTNKVKPLKPKHEENENDVNINSKTAHQATTSETTLKPKTQNKAPKPLKPKPQVTKDAFIPKQKPIDPLNINNGNENIDKESVYHSPNEVQNRPKPKKTLLQKALPFLKKSR